MKQPLTIGQKATLSLLGHEITGEVLTHHHDKKSGRHQYTLRDAAGVVHVLWTHAVGDVWTAFAGWKSDAGQAEAVALDHFNGTRTNLGVTYTINILAAAVLQMRGRRR